MTLEDAGGPAATPAAPVAADSDRIARNTAFALLMQLTTAAFTAALTLYLVRALGPHGYGLFAVAVGLSLLLAVPADVGISNSTSRFVLQHRDDPGAVADFVSDALRLKLLVSAAVALGLAAAAEPIADAYGAPDLVWPLRAVAVALFGQTILTLFRTTFIALGRAPAAFRVAASESAIEAGASIGLVALGLGAAGATLGRGVGYVAGAVIGLALASRHLGRSAVVVRRRSRGRSRRIAEYAGALVVIDGAFVLFNQVDVQIIAVMLGAASAGIFEAPMRLIAFLHYPGFAVAMGVAPRAASDARRELAPDAFARGLRLVLIVQAAMSAAILAWATPIVELVLGPGYDASADVLRALVPFVFLAGLGPLLSLSLTYLGEAGRRVPAAIVAVLVNIAIDLALVPRIGVVAGAIGTDVAYALYIAAHLTLCRRVLRVALRPFLATLGRVLLAGAAMAAVLTALGTAHLSIGTWAVGAVAGPAVFVAVLVLTRELSSGDLRALRRRIAAVRGGRATSRPGEGSI